MAYEHLTKICKDRWDDAVKKSKRAPTAICCEAKVAYGNLMRQLKDGRRSRVETVRKLCRTLSRLTGEEYVPGDLQAGIPSRSFHTRAFSQLESGQNPEKMAHRISNNVLLNELLLNRQPAQLFPKQTLVRSDGLIRAMLSDEDKRRLCERKMPLRIAIPRYQLTAAILFQRLIDCGVNIVLDFPTDTGTEILKSLIDGAHSCPDLFISADAHLIPVLNGAISGVRYHPMLPLFSHRQRVLAPINHKKADDRYHFHFHFDRECGLTHEYYHSMQYQIR